MTLFPGIDLAGILFFLVGVLLALYGFKSYRLFNTNPEIYLKWKDSSQDLIKAVMSPIIILLIASMLGSSYVLTMITVSTSPELGLFLRIFVGLLIGLYVGFFAARNLNLYKTKPEKYRRIVEERRKRDKESLPITWSDWLRMEKTYKKFIGNYWQIFGFCIIGALILIYINYVISNDISSNSMSLFLWGSVEHLFIIGGFVTLQSRKTGFLILQLAVIWLIFWSIITAIFPFTAIFLH